MKAQSAIEAAMLIAFLLTILTAFMTVIMNRMVESQVEQDRESLNDVADYIETELQLASGAEDGYKRNFNIPLQVAGKDYDLWFFDAATLGGKDFSELWLQYSGDYLAGHTTVKYLPVNVFGDIGKGSNNITKSSGIIQVTAASNVCKVKKVAQCGAGENDILHLSSLSNAHAELAGNYGYRLCCGNINIGVSSDEFFLSLSANTNAHASASISDYGVHLYIVPGSIDCTTISQAGDGYTVCNKFGGGYDSCLITLSGLSNAHLASCNYQPYNVKICCKLT